MAKVPAAVTPPEGTEYAELIIDKAQTRAIPTDTVWAKIGDDNQLEVLRWDLIEMYASQYDYDKSSRSQTHVICKLLVLVRDQTRKECA